jgi:Arc/MetJ-type ribon-helix-helix transcriptional regulator
LPAEQPVDQPAASKPQASGRPKKMTVNLDNQLQEDAKDAFWLARGQYRTFSAFVEEALRRHIRDTMDAHSVDQLPRRPGGSLPTGRPLS